MKFKKALHELQAEVVGGKIPTNKIFINQKIPDSVPPEWKKVLTDILTILKNKNLLNKFNKDAEPIDIEGTRPKGDITLVADDGSKYRYNVESGKLYNA